MDVRQVLAEIIDYLENWDIEPTKDKIKKVLNDWIENLHSHVGAEAHRHEIECGIDDLTGLTWEEQDAQMLQQIERYKKCLVTISQIPTEGFGDFLANYCE